MFLNLAEAEARARATLPAATYDYYAGGAADELTLAENRRAYDRLAVRPRVLVDVSRRDTSLSIAGTRCAAPILVAPMAFQRLAHPEGELAMARAAGALGLPMTASTFATCALEEIAAVATGPLWFQLYVHQDRGITTELVRRAEAAGYRALVLTVDVPEIGRRERDLRNGFRLTPELRAANFAAPESAPLTGGGGPQDSHLARFIHGVRDASISWKDVAWLRSLSGLPLIIKGVLRADDAVRAADHGARAIVVSNHGGRQLDTAIASIRALPEIAAAVGDGLEVLVDGGIRRGTDVLKALALGARAVMVGRPVLWGLAAGGEAGARRVLELLRDELDLAMALCGASRLAEIGAELVERTG